MDLYDVTGSYGPWQRRVFWVFFYVYTVGSWQTFSITFLAPDVDFKCVEPLPSTPLGHHHNATSFDDRCEVLVSNSTIPCTRWEYDTANFSRNIVSEWDLVCDRQWLVSLAKSVYMFGFLVSVIFFGQISDWLGRYPTMVACFLTTTTSMFLSLLSTSYTMFAVLRFFQAFGRTGLTTVGFVIVMEIMGPDHRTRAGVFLQAGFALGMSALPAVGWLVRDWFWFQLVLALSLLPFAASFWIVPESPRWLLMRGKKKRLERTLSAAVEINKRKLNVPVKDLDMLKNNEKDNEDTNTKTLFHLLKMPKMRNRTLIMIFLWNVNTFTYFGLSLNTNDIGGDPYLMFMLSGLMEFPSLLLLWWGTEKAGRRSTFVGCMVSAGIACTSIVAVPESVSWLRIVFAMSGKMFVTCSFGLLYIYTSELFPTVVRNVALGTCSMCARIGSMLAPFVRELGQSTHPAVPNVLYGVLALSSGLLALLLPETKGRTMPDTLEEGEEYGEEPPSSLPSNILKEKLVVQEIPLSPPT